MENNTESEIVIKMKHIDHANKLEKTLLCMKEVASQGGDLNIIINDLKYTFYIGHDVNIKSIEHIKGHQ